MSCGRYKPLGFLFVFVSFLGVLFGEVYLDSEFACENVLRSVEGEEWSVELGGVFVLCYHSFTNIPHNITFTMGALDNHIQRLVDNGFNFITTEEFLSKRYSGFNNVLVTIDDGHKSTYTAYQEVFKKYGVKPLIAINTSNIGVGSAFLSWEQVEYLAGEGCGIAAHGHTHQYLHRAAFSTAPTVSRREIDESTRIITERLGERPVVFVYPFGDRCAEAIAHLDALGYKYAFTVDKGIIYNDTQDANRFELPRYMLMNSNVERVFRAMALEVMDKR